MKQNYTRIKNDLSKCGQSVSYLLLNNACNKGHIQIFWLQMKFIGCMRQALGPRALGKPRGSGWRGRWEGGSGWGTHVNPWLFHFNAWKNPLQIKKKKRNLLPMEGTQVRSYMWEDPTWGGAAKPLHHNYWSPCTLEPVLHNKRSHRNEKPTPHTTATRE